MRPCWCCKQQGREAQPPAPAETIPCTLGPSPLPRLPSRLSIQHSTPHHAPHLACHPPFTSPATPPSPRLPPPLHLACHPTFTRLTPTFTPLAQVAIALQDAALSDEYFISRKLYPNVDFYSGLVYRAMGFLPQYFTVLFAIPRIVGYCAHWREMQNDPDLKIVRPQQDYRGVWLRHYAAMDQRASGQHADGLTKLPPSNAYQRRVAGENWQ
jgi:hypothetical protein